jgi:putative hydrolase of the HAD superfamily
MKHPFLHTIDVLIFDADDTLWENNIYYINASEALFNIAEETGSERSEVEEYFYLREHEMVTEFGYGREVFIKVMRRFYDEYPGFEHSDSLAARFEQIVTDFQARWKKKPKLFPGVKKSLLRLNGKFVNYILTKGNHEEQLHKIHRSGLLPYFKGYFIEPEKNLETLQKILNKHGWDPEQVCMIGNSPKSDINPALSLGLHAIYIPYTYTWRLDNEDVISGHPNLHTIRSFSDLPRLLLD